jgi:hypothetical protein
VPLKRGLKRGLLNPQAAADLNSRNPSNVARDNRGLKAEVADGRLPLNTQQIVRRLPEVGHSGISTVPDQWGRVGAVNNRGFQVVLLKEGVILLTGYKRISSSEFRDF